MPSMSMRVFFNRWSTKKALPWVVMLGKCHMRVGDVCGACGHTRFHGFWLALLAGSTRGRERVTRKPGPSPQSRFHRFADPGRAGMAGLELNDTSFLHACRAYHAAFGRTLIKPAAHICIIGLAISLIHGATDLPGVRATKQSKSRNGRTVSENKRTVSKSGRTNARNLAISENDWQTKCWKCFVKTLWVKNL